MEKCVGCHFYDRDHGQATTGGIRWGQCRRSAPRLHPVNQKSFMIEGVWPHVRDDDWCGEWKAAIPRTEGRPPADRLGAMLSSGAPPATLHAGMRPVRPVTGAPGPGAALPRTAQATFGSATLAAGSAVPRPAASATEVGARTTAADLGVLPVAGSAD
ncbi:MAG: hypothetical protein IT516_00380 [Burkholderiales bacterium]|nr:hypothetical protein [Burkholderiales bacterium]